MARNTDGSALAPQAANHSDEFLLRQYVRLGSQTAFAALVRRYGRLVQATCLREVDDPQLAEDVTQVVFLLLARKAPSLLGVNSLAGWLFRAARFSARNALRHERRRRIGEQEVVAAMTELHHNGPPVASWDLLEPQLNAALASLRPHEQEVILLRYLEGASWRETAARLGLAEDAAQKRGTRAVEKMRRFVNQQGYMFSLDALIALLTEEAARSAPLPAAVIGKTINKVANGGLPSPNVSSLNQGVMHTMNMKMIKSVVAPGSFAVIAVISGILWVKHTYASIHFSQFQVTASEPRTAKTPQDMLMQVRDHYHRLSSFSTQIIQEDSSGLYPGAYTQQLDWHRSAQVEGSSGRFALRNLTPSNKTLRGDLSSTNDPRAVPDFLADGKQVISVWPSGRRNIEWEAPQPNSEPGWEVTGGPILSWLQDTPNGRFFLAPPPGGTIIWSFGPRTVWHGQKVRELCARRTYADEVRFTTCSYFLRATAPILVGAEAFTGWSKGGKIGYSLYVNQQENPSLPATLGNAL